MDDRFGQFRVSHFLQNQKKKKFFSIKYFSKMTKSARVMFSPFLFPFSLRRSFIYCTSFGRDRALMHLVSQVTPKKNENKFSNFRFQSEGGHGENSESGRLTHRLEKRKLLVKRDDLLKTSEAALANNASSRLGFSIFLKQV